MLFRKFMQVIGLEPQPADPRFATYAQRKVNEDALLAIVEPAIRERQSDELETALMEVGVPCGRLNNFEEVFEHPQIVARGMVEEIEHPRLGTHERHAQPGAARPRRPRHRTALRRCSASIRRKSCASLAMRRRDPRAGRGGRDEARGAGAAQGHGGGIVSFAVAGRTGRSRFADAPAPQLSLRAGQPREVPRQGDGSCRPTPSSSTSRIRCRRRRRQSHAPA